jgi:hypothetical protein
VFVAFVQVRPHDFEAVLHQAERHLEIGCALVFDQAVNVAFARRGFERVEDVGAGGAQGGVDEGVWLGAQGVEFADSAQRGRQVDVEEVSRRFGVAGFRGQRTEDRGLKTEDSPVTGRFAPANITVFRPLSSVL